MIEYNFKTHKKVSMYKKSNNVCEINLKKAYLMLSLVSREVMTKIIQIPSPEKQKVIIPPMTLKYRASLFNIEPTTAINTLTKIDDVVTKIID
jgi:hypothetical protein